jgi:hypothetical protein
MPLPRRGVHSVCVLAPTLRMGVSHFETTPVVAPPVAGPQAAVTGDARDVEALHAELAHVYTKLAELSQELADEQAYARTLRSVIALAPYATRKRPALRERG